MKRPLYRLAICVLCIGLLIVIGEKKLRIFYPSGITIVTVVNATSGIQGGGFFIDSQYILTASHLVEAGVLNPVIGELKVFDDQHWHPVKVIGLDTESDLALLKPLEWCSIPRYTPCVREVNYTEKDEEVIVYPRQYRYTFEKFFSGGVHYGKILSFEDWISAMVINHTAGIGPGYSGTPLLDSHHCYFGVNGGYFLDKTSNKTGIAYAMSTTTIKEIVPDLIKFGYVERPFLGIILIQPSSGGVLISEVVKNTSAERLSQHGVAVFHNINRPAPYPTHRLVSINDIKVTTLSQCWQLLKSLDSRSIVKVVSQDLSGNIYTDLISAEPRFSSVRKYIPFDRFVARTYQLVFVI